MAVDDPPIPCVGSVHVPGCAHLGPLPGITNGLAPADAMARPSYDEIVARARSEGMLEAMAQMAFHTPEPSLDLVLRVRVTRRGRHRCPGCGKVRQLLALTAFSDDQPVGYGTALCRACADLRPS